jgi:hypothetical protein
MATAINLQELEQELTRTKTMFEQWSAVMLSRAQGCKSTHTSKLLASKGWQQMLNIVQQHVHMQSCRNTCSCMASLQARWQH